METVEQIALRAARELDESNVMDCGPNGIVVTLMADELAEVCCRFMAEATKQKPVGFLCCGDDEFQREGGGTLYGVEQKSCFGRTYRNLPLYRSPVVPAQAQAEPEPDADALHIAYEMGRANRTRAPLPDVLFDGYAVLQALPENARARTGPENVSDVLDAVVRIIRVSNTDAPCVSQTAESETQAGLSIAGETQANQVQQARADVLLQLAGIMDHGGTLSAEGLRRLADEEVRCQTCDGTGDVHRAYGEWLGECDCQAEKELPPLPKELVRVDMNDDGSWGELQEHAWDSDYARDLVLNAPLFTVGQMQCYARAAINAAMNKGGK